MSEKTRTRTFTGCYTCRQRKLKCDNARPACRRCIALGVECQGYEVRLSWLAYDDTRGSKKRQSGATSALGGSEGTLCRRPLFTEAERRRMVRSTQSLFVRGDQDLNITQALHQLEYKAEAGMQYASGVEAIGPFSVYQLDAPQTTAPSESATSDSTFHGPAPTFFADNLTDNTVLPIHGYDIEPAVDTMGADAQLPWPSFTDLDDVFPSNQEFLQPLSNLLASPSFVADVPQMINYNDFGITDQLRFFAPSIAEPASNTTYSTRPYHKSTTYVDQSGNVMPWSAEHNFLTLSSYDHIPRAVSNSTNLSKIPPEARYLLEYYATDVVNFMCHLPNANSPWRTIHLPCAMSTLADLLVFGIADNARMGLFYALLSVASNHLGSLPPSSESTDERWHTDSGSSMAPSGLATCRHWISKGSQFQARATAHIQASLSSKHDLRDQDRYKELLMSLLSMVTISVTSGKMEAADKYLHEAKKLIASYNVLLRSSISSFKSSKVVALHQIYSYLQIIYSSTRVRRALVQYQNPIGYFTLSSTLANIEELETSPDDTASSTSPNDTDALAEHNDDYQLFAKIYGVPRSLLSLIAKATDMACQLEESNYAPIDFEPVHALEDKICTWRQADDETSPTGSSYDPSIASHLVRAMHDALIVMFYRRVRKVHRLVLQHYVEGAADHMNEQETIKTQTGINTPALVWPWFMVASEAVHENTRDKLRLWSSHAKRYGGRNLEAAEKVVNEVWRRHDRQLSKATWVDVVREWEIDLVLT